MLPEHTQIMTACRLMFTVGLVLGRICLHGRAVLLVGMVGLVVEVHNV